MAKNNKTETLKIPNFVTRVTKTLNDAGFESFLVGGCVRDIILEKEPKDWDVTTNATPDEIIKLFDKTIYENSFGTVGVCIPKDVSRSSNVTREMVTHETDDHNVTHVTRDDDVTCVTEPIVTRVTEYDIVEVTPYRIESKYSDFRHPDKVEFSNNIEDDLKRRDFTMNALALNIGNDELINELVTNNIMTDRNIKDNYKGQFIDLFGGIKDIKDKIIRAVGNANKRFEEDALRMLRAVRFSTQIGFVIDYETMNAIVNNSSLLGKISGERIRDEFIKIIESNNPSTGIALLQKLGLLKHMIPELEEGIGCIQGGAHIYDVFEHSLQALDHAAQKGFSTEIRLAALFHDIGKPRSRRNSLPSKLEFNLSDCQARNDKKPDRDRLNYNFSNNKTKKKYTFYGHEVIGAKIAEEIMERLKFPKKTIDLVVSLIRNHMFFSDTEQISLSAVRRIVQKVGREHIWELMEIRECDRAGMKKNEAPYRLRKYHAMIEEVLHDPISVTQLKINGETLIKELHMKPGPRMGWVLNALLEEVLDDPQKNTKEHLVELTKSLNLLNDEELKALGERGKVKKEEAEKKVIEELHYKHQVNK